MATQDDLTWDEAHRALIPLMRADNRTNLRFILLEYALLISTLAGCILAYHAWTGGRLPTLGFVPLAALGIVMIGAVQHRLSGLAHDASHYTLFRNKWANELVSDWLLMFPLMAMTQRFRASHLGHHRFVNDPVRDPDVVRLNEPVPEPFPTTKKRFWYRYVFSSLFWPPTLLRYLYGQAKNANVETDDGPKIRSLYTFKQGRIMRTAFWLTTMSVVLATHSLPIFLLFWVAPLLTSYPFLMQLREIAHHSNAPDDGSFTNSRIFLVHPLLDFAVFNYGQAYHVTHHLFAMLPHYRMAEAHAILMRHQPYRDGVVVCRGYFFRTIGTDGPSVLEELVRKDCVGVPQPREGATFASGA